MRLLEPYFLYTFLALAIPILIHLFSLRRHKTVFFSNVVFLKQLQEKRKNISKLQNLLLLLIRIALFSFLIIAFSRPYLTDNKQEIEQGKQLIGIYLDNSFSMSAQNDKGRLLDQAKLKAEAIVNAYKSQDDFILITNELQGKHQRILTREESVDAIENIDIVPQVLKSTNIFSRWESLKQNERYELEDLFIISDFQAEIFQDSDWQSDTSYHLNLVPLEAYPQNNLVIEDCYFGAPYHALGQQENLLVRIHNYSEEDLQNIPIKLYIDDKQKALSSIDIEANKSVEAMLSFTNHQAGSIQAKLSIQDQPINFDDDLYFSYIVAEQMKVLSIYDQNPNKSLIALFADDNFEHLQFEAQHIDYKSFAQQDLIVLSNLKNLSTGLINTLEQYLSQGGNLLLFPSARMNTQSYKQLSNTFDLPTYKRLKRQRLKVNTINKKHQLLKDVFESNTKTEDLPLVKEYYTFSSSYSASEEAILNMVNGNVLLSSYDYKKGNVYLFSTPLGTRYSNVEEHALFVPLLHNMAQQKQNDKALYHTIGEQEIISFNASSNTDARWHITGNDNIDILPEIRSQQHTLQANLQGQIVKAGHYSLTNGETTIALGFNYDRNESRLTPFSSEKLEALAANHPHISLQYDSGIDLVNSIKNKTQGTSIWQAFMLAGLIALIAESLLLIFWKKKAQTTNKINSSV